MHTNSVGGVIICGHVEPAIGDVLTCDFRTLDDELRLDSGFDDNVGGCGQKAER